jgi:hypothetical protein
MIPTMKTPLMALVALLIFTCDSRAQLATNTMMKIVTRDTSPDVPRASFASLPKTLYRIGQTYARLEEQPDPAQGIHGLIIVAEPKVWMINLFDHTGKMMTDPGPTYIFQASIIPPKDQDSKPVLADFEYGMEYEFLRKHGAASSQEKIDGTLYDKLSLVLDGYQIVLLSHQGQIKPFRVTVSQNDAILYQCDYDQYLTHLPPQMDLFQPPSQIRMAEMTLDELSEQSTVFYQNPSKETFETLGKEADLHAEELIQDDGHAALLFSVFLYRAAEKNGWKISGHGRISILAADLKDGTSRLAKFVRDDSRVDATRLDIWWSSYFATGETEYLNKIMKYAGRELPEKNVEGMLTIGAASWSFKANCRQHESIRKFAEACLADPRYEDRRSYLEECIHDTQEKEKP